ncbi:MAG: dephospho-CoA kinase [Chitinophagales bacterium]
MLKIGLTGGIGSGKSTIARIFEVLGIPCYYADEAAKKLMNEDDDLRKQLILHFGNQAYRGAELNRAYIAGMVFNDKEKLELLNSLVHPATIRDAGQWMDRQHSPYAIKEAALIFETGSEQWLDKIIGIYAPESLRIQRTMARDQISREDVFDRMKNQMDEEKKMKLCDFVIHNDEQQPVIPQVIELHRQLIKLSGQ